MNWIEIDGILVNLNTITTISMFDKTVRLWIVSETIPFDVEFDTEEQAKARYEGLKTMLLFKPNVDDLLSESEVAFMKHRAGVSE